MKTQTPSKRRARRSFPKRKQSLPAKRPGTKTMKKSIEIPAESAKAMMERSPDQENL
ncbi:MAG TPA: hypothetical protein VG710_08195 [Opitutus sp.]|nr:hypothetical protein [Opitutus sp.]